MVCSPRQRSQENCESLLDRYLEEGCALTRRQTSEKDEGNYVSGALRGSWQSLLGTVGTMLVFWSTAMASLGEVETKVRFLKMLEAIALSRKSL